MSTQVDQQPYDSAVRTEVDGPVATVTLARPEQLNAQTPHTWQGLVEAGATLPADVRVVVVRGEGRAFSAGLDKAMFTGGVPGVPGLPQLATMDPAHAESLIEGWQAGLDWLRRPDIVSVAAVQGHAIGAGFQLALACDIRVLTEDAQLCMAETTLGLVPDLTGSKALVDLVGPSRAMEICLTGRRIGADEASRIGLASLVVPTAGLDAAVDDLVAALLSPPRGAVTETKALLVAAGGRTHAEQQAAERAAQVRRIAALAAGEG